VLCDDSREREIGDEGGNDVEDTSEYAKSGAQLDALGLEDLISVCLPAGLGVVPAVSEMVK
jgi:hypothetical protein